MSDATKRIIWGDKNKMFSIVKAGDDLASKLMNGHSKLSVDTK